jgi:L-amino acid N-acyltransferase YncA
MQNEYPKKVTLPDGRSLTLRPMTRDDQYGLYQFFVGLSEEDRRFLRNDVTDRKLIEKWTRNLDYDKVLPILADYDGKIVANATLHYQTFGWGRHIAEIRITIAPEFQGRGLGSMLLVEMSQLAVTHQVRKLLARIVTNREAVIKTFEKAGFGLVTVLRNYVKDIHQESYADIALLVKELRGSN